MYHGHILVTNRASHCVKTDKQKVSVDANICAFALVGRIMKKALPDNARFSKEAKVCVQQCASEFISFITSESESIGNLLARWQ